MLCVGTRSLDALRHVTACHRVTSIRRKPHHVCNESIHPLKATTPPNTITSNTHARAAKNTLPALGVGAMQ